MRGLVCVACLCGSSDRLIRNFLQKAGYSDFLSIPIYQGKEQSRRALKTLPRTPEVEALDSFIQNSSKWAVIIGVDGQTVRWSDLSHGGAKSSVEAEYVVKTFGL